MCNSSHLAILYITTHYYDVIIEPVVLVRVINHKVLLGSFTCLFLARRLCMLLSCCHMIKFCLIIVTHNCNPFITYYYIFIIPTLLNRHHHHHQIHHHQIHHHHHHHHIIINDHYYNIITSLVRHFHKWKIMLEPLWLSNSLCNYYVFIITLLLPVITLL